MRLFHSHASYWTPKQDALSVPNYVLAGEGQISARRSGALLGMRLNKQIAGDLDIAEPTVEMHHGAAMRKIGGADRGRAGAHGPAAWTGWLTLRFVAALRPAKLLNFPAYRPERQGGP